MTLVISRGITLDNGTTPAAIAGLSPTLDYRFAREKREIETVSLTDKLTFTGGNQGTFVGSDGFIQRATTNIPRFDHDPLSRRSLGLLSEVERTNLFEQSNNFNTTWVRGNCNVTAASDTAPDGTNTAWLITDTVDVSNVSHSVGQVISGTSGTTYTMSAWAKAGTLPRIVLSFPSQVFGSNLTVRFNLQTGAIVTPSAGTTNTITSFANGWYRVTISATATATASAQFQLRLDTGTTASYQGDGTGTIFVWGAQLEAASTPSTYIPTTTTAVTRTADSAVIDGTGILTGTYTMVEKPAGCAIESGGSIVLQTGFTAERVMVFPTALTAGQITAIRGAM